MIEYQGKDWGSNLDIQHFFVEMNLGVPMKKLSQHINTRDIAENLESALEQLEVYMRA